MEEYSSQALIGNVESACSLALFLQVATGLIFLILGLFPNPPLYLLIIIGLLNIFYGVYRTKRMLDFLYRNDLSNAYVLSCDLINIVVGFLCGVLPGILLLYSNRELAQMTGNKPFAQMYLFPTAQKKIEFRKAIETEVVQPKEALKTSKLPQRDERERIKEYLGKLEALYREGKLSQEIYEKLKKEYESKLAKLN